MLVLNWELRRASATELLLAIVDEMQYVSVVIHWMVRYEYRTIHRDILNIPGMVLVLESLLEVLCTLSRFDP